MKSFFAVAALLSFVLASADHDHHHEEQMPMGYMKYPYQAWVPHDDGEFDLLSCVRLLTYTPYSDSVLCILRYHHVCQAALGRLPQ